MTTTTTAAPAFKLGDPELIRQTFMATATDAELRSFIEVCERLQLDPFARQIFAVARWDGRARREVWSAQVSIDGFRIVAERTGEYRGQAQPQWCGKDGVWRDVWLAAEPPAAARIGVHRKDFAEPLYRVARFASYVQTGRDNKPTKTWQTMPDVMISKCAEALALRTAFPHVLSGVYTTDEMAQATHAIDTDGHEVAAAAPPKALPATATPPAPAAAAPPPAPPTTAAPAAPPPNTPPPLDPVVADLVAQLQKAQPGDVDVLVAKARGMFRSVFPHERQALTDAVEFARAAIAQEMAATP